MNLFFGRDLYRLKILLCNFHFVQNSIWSLKFEPFEHWLTLLKRKGESISQEAPQTWFHLTIFQLQRHNWILDILWGLVEVEIVTSIRWFLSVPPQNWLHKTDKKQKFIQGWVGPSVDFLALGHFWRGTVVPSSHLIRSCMNQNKYRPRVGVFLLKPRLDSTIS